MRSPGRTILLSPDPSRPHGDTAQTRPDTEIAYFASRARAGGRLRTRTSSSAGSGAAGRGPPPQRALGGDPDRLTGRRLAEFVTVVGQAAICLQGSLLSERRCYSRFHRPTTTRLARGIDISDSQHVYSASFSAPILRHRLRRRRYSRAGVRGAFAAPRVAHGETPPDSLNRFWTGPTSGRGSVLAGRALVSVSPDARALLSSASQQVVGQRDEPRVDDDRDRHDPVSAAAHRAHQRRGLTRDPCGELLPRDHVVLLHGSKGYRPGLGGCSPGEQVRRKASSCRLAHSRRERHYRRPALTASALIHAYNKVLVP